MIRRRTLVLFAVAAALLLSLAGCNGFFVDDVTEEGEFVFVANNNAGTSGSVSGFLIDDGSGSLSQISGSPFAAGTGPLDVHSDADGRFLYVANQSNISAYTIDADNGRLTSVGDPFTSTAPVALAVDPAARFLFVLSSAGVVTPLRIDSSTGALSTAGTESQAGSAPREIHVAPSGALVYVAGGSSGTFVFSVNSSDGSLANNQTVTPAASGFHTDVVVEPQGRFAYVVDSENDQVHAFTVASTTGQLAEITGSPYETGGVPFAVAVDPTANFVYVVNRGSGDVSGYTIGSDGALTEMANSPFDAGTTPESLAVDPSGRFLYVANRGSNNLSVFQINTTTGALSATGTRSTGTEPVSVVAVP